MKKRKQTVDLPLYRKYGSALWLKSSHLWSSGYHRAASADFRWSRFGWGDSPAPTNLILDTHVKLWRPVGEDWERVTRWSVKGYLGFFPFVLSVLWVEQFRRWDLRASQSNSSRDARKGTALQPVNLWIDFVIFGFSSAHFCHHPFSTLSSPRIRTKSALAQSQSVR